MASVDHKLKPYTPGFCKNAAAILPSEFASSVCEQLGFEKRALQVEFAQKIAADSSADIAVEAAAGSGKMLLVAIASLALDPRSKQMRFGATLDPVAAFQVKARLVLLVLPLRALIVDAKGRLGQILGTASDFYKSVMVLEASARPTARALAQKRVLIASPESFAAAASDQGPVWEFLCQIAASKELVVFLDEAHLVFLWSSFRPYAAVLDAISRMPDVPVVTTSGTMPVSLLDRVFARLSRPTPATPLRFPLERTHIVPRLRRTQNGRSGKLIELRKSLEVPLRGTTIVFADTRKEAAWIATEIKEFAPIGVKVRCVHGGHKRAVKEEALHEAKAANACLWIAATAAFGTGVDVESSLVIHWDVPLNVVDLYQQVLTFEFGLKG